MKLRWLVIETDNGRHRPEWPKTMSFGMPWIQFTRSKPVLQYFVKGKWIDVPTEVIKKEKP